MHKVTRRSLIAAGLLAPIQAFGTDAPEARFAQALDSIGAKARLAGVPDALTSQVLGQLVYQPQTVRLDQHQPEFTQTWAQYRATHVSKERLTAGIAARNQYRDWLDRASRQFGVSPAALLGIWGIETNYGAQQGTTRVPDALATLVADGRREALFLTESVSALQILQAGDIGLDRMDGSWSGAMGQPQFMPSSFLRFATDLDGDGRRDIWISVADSLGSIANFLARNGWSSGDPIVEQVSALPPGTPVGRDHRARVGQWMQAGVRRWDGQDLPNGDWAYVITPGGPDAPAFLAYPNFDVLRRYNPSDFYALAVSLVGIGVLQAP